MYVNTDKVDADYLFVSYSPASKPLVLQIQDRLTEAGFKVWTDDENTCTYLKPLPLLLSHHIEQTEAGLKGLCRPIRENI